MESNKTQTEDRMDTFTKIINFLEAGKTVYFTTAYRSTKVSKKHIKMLSCKNGHIYINGIDYSYTKITVA
jgi:hypothetical protein